MQEKGEDIPLLLSRMEETGMEGIDIGTVSDDLALRFPLSSHCPFVSRSAGIGPWAVGESLDVLKKQIETYGPVCAIGEIGLDNHWKDYAPKGEQEALFVSQLDLAEEMGKPIIIHSREADLQMISILSSRSFSRRGIMHCFEGSEKLLSVALSKGFYISFSGVLTYKGNDTLRKLAVTVPHDRLLLETDSPYLSPVPLRGTRNNPLNVSYVYKTMSLISGRNEADLQTQNVTNLHAFLHQA